VRPASRLGSSSSSSSISSSPSSGGGSDNTWSPSTTVEKKNKGLILQLRRSVKSTMTKTKNLFLGNGFTENTSLTEKGAVKKALASLGLNALLAYGFVSNVSYITCLILSWVSHGKATGLSPLAQGQWKPFLAIYAGFWAANNLLRPLRFSLSLVITPFFTALIDKVVQKTGFKRPTATGIVVFLVNVCGTISYLILGLLAATTITGVPLRP